MKDIGQIDTTTVERNNQNNQNNRYNQQNQKQDGIVGKQQKIPNLSVAPNYHLENDETELINNTSNYNDLNPNNIKCQEITIEMEFQKEYEVEDDEYSAIILHVAKQLL